MLNVSGTFALAIEWVQPDPEAWFAIESGQCLVKGKSPMAYTLPDEMMIAVTVSYQDAHGNPAKVDGDTAWSSSDDAIALVQVNANDSTKAEVSAKGLGQAQITARADADLGGGTKEILATLDIEVVAGEAVTATISPSGEPQPISK